MPCVYELVKLFLRISFITKYILSLLAHKHSGSQYEVFEEILFRGRNHTSLKDGNWWLTHSSVVPLTDLMKKRNRLDPRHFDFILKMENKYL